MPDFRRSCLSAASAGVLLLFGGVAQAGPDPRPEPDVAPPAPALAAPASISAAGQAINVDVGHAAPFVTDWNGDGKADLLVGQFGSGHLRIYLNEGEPHAPRFGAHTLFEAGGATASVPSG